VIKPAVAIVGRPNVGKSTLFNRLARSRLAIVRDEPGVTRDRIYASCKWQNRHFSIIDTGGLNLLPQDQLWRQVKEQAEVALKEAQVAILLLDARQGLNPLDKELAHQLHKKGKPLVVAVNKIDSPKNQDHLADFYALGLPQIFPISAEHGLGIGDLIDEVIRLLPDTQAESTSPEPSCLKIAVVGRPNVGKSTFINYLLDEERMLVSQEPGTTRDAIDSTIQINKHKYILIDTAGIRKRARVKNVLEKYSVIKALKAIERCDVALVLLDAAEGITDQDIKIASYAHSAGKATVVAINKWDLMPQNTSAMLKYKQQIKERLKLMNYIPLIFISAQTGQRVPNTLKLISEVGKQYARRLPTAALNELLQQATYRHQPPSYQGKAVKLFYITQASAKPPTFVLFAHNPRGIGQAYRRYLINQIRGAFNMTGTPLFIISRKRR
jgi:GTP-binding protein